MNDDVSPYLVQPARTLEDVLRLRAQKHARRIRLPSANKTALLLDAGAQKALDELSLKQQEGQ